MAKSRSKQADQPEFDNEQVQTSSIDFTKAKATLEKHPHVHTIHVNDKGEWHFQHRPGFTPFTREDILNG